MEKIVRRRYWWFLVSLLIIIPGLVSLSLYGLRPSIDFSGGALWDVYFPDKQSSDLNTEKISQLFAAQGFEGAVVQLSQVTVAGKSIPSALIRTKSLDPNTAEVQQRNIRSALQAEYGASMQLEQVQSVGATVSQESTRSAVIAVLGACVASTPWSFHTSCSVVSQPMPWMKAPSTWPMSMAGFSDLPAS